jgi:hypothetical protein
MRLLEESSLDNGLLFSAFPANYDKRRLNTIDKVHLLRAFLETGAVAENDVLLFTDAYDVLILDHAAVIHDRFTSLEVDIIANAEANFYPDHRADLRRVFDTVPSKWRYLNSGCYIGYAWAIRIMLHYIISAIPQSEAAEHYLDQMLMQEFYVKGAGDHNIRMSLDHDTWLFSPLLMSEGDFVLDRGAVRNKTNGRQTCILHANGDRQNMRALEAIASLAKFSPRYMALALVDGKTLCYDVDGQKLTISSHDDNPVLFLIDGKRAFTFSHSCDRLTYFPDFTIRNDSAAINVWETLILSHGGIQTYHGTFIESFVAGDGHGRAELAPVPLSLLRASFMPQCLARFAAIADAV